MRIADVRLQGLKIWRAVDALPGSTALAKQAGDECFAAGVIRVVCSEQLEYLGQDEERQGKERGEVLLWCAAVTEDTELGCFSRIALDFYPTSTSSPTKEAVTLPRRTFAARFQAAKSSSALGLESRYSHTSLMRGSLAGSTSS